ncbi:MAG: hypothetical protein QXM96_03455 [Candidatus Woesearchaeota archaeon]
MSNITHFIIKKYKLLNIVYFILSTFALVLIFYFYYKKIIIPELFRAVVFLYFLVLFFFFSMYFFVYRRIYKLAKALDFKYLEGSFPHPKFEGYYKNNWFQIHYVSRDHGSNWGQPRTYIKLQHKDLKNYDINKLKKYENYVLKSNKNTHKIVEIKHIIRDYKNYLLLKREYPTFNINRIKELMDFLIQVEKEVLKNKKNNKKN